MNPTPRPEPDHVDRVRAQWREVRPEIDTSPAAIVARVGRLGAYFDQAINQLMGEYGLTRSSWDILSSLRRSGPPYELTPTELYRGLMRSSGWMTNRLHGLEEAGLVQRRADPGDGRGVIIRLTKNGLRLVDEIIGQHVENEREMIAALPERDRKMLESLLRRLLQEHERKSPDPPAPRPPRHKSRRK